MKNAVIVLLSFSIMALLVNSCGEDSEMPTRTEQNERDELSFVTIPGGTFRMGDFENIGDGHEKPVHSVILSGFDMSLSEVTNMQYCGYLNEAIALGDIAVIDECVTSTKGADRGKAYVSIAISGSASSIRITYNHNTFSVTPDYEYWPVQWVTWHGAKAFAIWNGTDLPTEAEWEYACRGGIECTYGTNDGHICDKRANFNANEGHPVQVMSYPANPFGLFDMSGNVWEWCNDGYGSYPVENIENPTGAQTTEERIFRGGSWLDPDFQCRAAFRGHGGSESLLENIGFRVVRRPGELVY